MSDAIEDIAREADGRLARLYITVTAEAVAIDAAIVILIFAMLGLSSFTVMQAIGTTLFALVVGGAVLHVRRRGVRRRTLEALQGAGIPEDDFSEFLRSKPTDFDFLRDMFLAPKKGQKTE